MTMPSLLYPTFEKRVTDAFRTLQRQQVDPWAFFGSGTDVTVKTFDGRTICYAGVRFEGSPQAVFWSRYIEPFLEDLVIRFIAEAAKEARERGVNGREVLAEVEGLLVAGCAKIYSRMADIDRRLIGRGFPQNVPLRSTTREVHLINEFIAKHVRAEQQLWKAKGSFDLWYERNRAWVWAATTVVAIAGTVAKIVFGG